MGGITLESLGQLCRVDSTQNSSKSEVKLEEPKKKKKQSKKVKCEDNPQPSGENTVKKIESESIEWL